jgi:hypothetical protein
MVSFQCPSETLEKGGIFDNKIKGIVTVLLNFKLPFSFLLPPDTHQGTVQQLSRNLFK